MVYAFLIHTLFPGPCKLLYHQVYGLERSLERDAVGGNQNTSSEIKKHMEYVASQVHSEYQFRRAVASRTVEDEVQALSQEDQLPEFELGFLHFSESSPFSSEKIVVWLGTGNSGFTLVCHRDENRLLAESILKLIIQYLQTYMRVLNQPAEVSLKADRVGLILSHFLPEGSLIFMNHRVIRGLERELEIAMKS